MKKLSKILVAVLITVCACMSFGCGDADPNHTHSYTKKNTVDATCQARGYTVYQCSCGDYYTDDYVDKVSHDYSNVSIIEATCKEGGYTLNKCKYCSDSYKSNTTAKTAHSGRGVCTVCKENLFNLGKNFIIKNCTPNSSGNYVYSISATLSSTVFIFMYMYEPDDNEITLSVYSEDILCFFTIDKNVSGKYTWSISHSGYSYMMIGNLTASSFTENTTYLTYTTTTTPSSITLNFSELGATMIKLILTKFNVDCKSLGISVANLGFTSF